MSSVLEDSAPTVVDQLKLFDVPQTEKGVVRSEFIEYAPLGQVTQLSPVDFRIVTQENQYLDLNRSLLKVTFRIVDSEGVIAIADDPVAPVDSILHSLWRQIEVFLNQVLISSSTNNYAYKANINYRLNATFQNNAIAESSGYVGDVWSIGFGSTGNTIRRDLLENGKVVTYCGPLLADVCSTKKWILPGIETVIRLWQNSEEFRISTGGAATAKGYKIGFQEIRFLANIITVQPEVTLAHKQILQKENAKYPYTRTRLHTYNISQGSSFFKQDQIFQNEKPDRVVVAFVLTEAYLGKYEENPFTYMPGIRAEESGAVTFIKTIDFTVDDKSMNGKPFELNFAKVAEAEDYTGFQEAFYARFNQLGQYPLTSNAGNDSFALIPTIGTIDFTVSSFAFNSSFYVFDEYGGLPKPQNTVTDMHKGNSRLNVVFEAPTDANLTVIVYGEFNDMFEINKDKNVIRRY